jgi:hypothetical protein
MEEREEIIYRRGKQPKKDETLRLKKIEVE